MMFFLNTKKHYKRQSYDTLLAVNNLGLSYHNLGDYEKAESFYRRSIEGNEVALGKDHPMTLSSIKI